MAEATQQLSLQHWPAKRRTLGEILKSLVGSEHWAALVEHSRHYPGVPLGLKASAELHFDPRWWAAMQACSPLLDAWNAGDLTAYGRRRDPLLPPVEIAPPAIGWTLLVRDFPQSTIADPASTRENPTCIYDLQFARREEDSDAVAWIKAEARRMKADRLFVDIHSKAAFARVLEKRSNKSPWPLKRRYIAKMVEDWKLWPIDSIE